MRRGPGLASLCQKRRAAGRTPPQPAAQQGPPPRTGQPPQKDTRSSLYVQSHNHGSTPCKGILCVGGVTCTRCHRWKPVLRSPAMATHPSPSTAKSPTSGDGNNGTTETNRSSDCGNADTPITAIHPCSQGITPSSISTSTTRTPPKPPAS